MIPMVDLRAQYASIKREIDDAVGRVLESGHFPYVEDSDGLLSAIAAFFVDLSR